MRYWILAGGGDLREHGLAPAAEGSRDSGAACAVFWGVSKANLPVAVAALEYCYVRGSLSGRSRDTKTSGGRATEGGAGRCSPSTDT